MKALRISLVSVVIGVFCFFVSASTSLAQTNPTQTAAISFARDLKLNASGDDVTALQIYLISEGFLSIPSPTGFYGTRTRQALGAWQARAGISPTSGFFGPLSRARMNADIWGVIANTVAPVISTTTANLPVFTSTQAARGNPTRLKIPQLTVDAPFIPVGLTATGAMDAPKTLTEVGWYTGGVRPGEIGTAVADGHVSQIRAGVATLPGVFSRLNELHAGDIMYVVNDRGETKTFVVRETRLFDPASDTTSLFTSSDGKAHLNIITCDGTWDPVLKSFSKRLVIFAVAL